MITRGFNGNATKNGTVPIMYVHILFCFYLR